MANLKLDEVVVLTSEEIAAIDAEMEQSLIKGNVTDTILAELKKHKTLSITKSSDKENYLIVKEARKECKRVRVLADKICKKGRERANAEASKWIGKGKDITAEILETEDYLEKMETEWEEEDDRVKKEKAAKIEQQGIARMADMLKFGASLVEGRWVLEDLMYEAVMVKEAGDEQWTEIREEYKAIFNGKEKIRLDAEQASKDLEKKVKEQEENARQMKDEIFAFRMDRLGGWTYAMTTDVVLNATKDVYGKKENIINLSKEAFEALVVKNTEENEARREEQKKQDENKTALEIRTKTRTKQMYDFGLTFDFGDNHFKGFDCFVASLDITCMEDERWDKEMAKMGPHIEAYKERASAKEKEEKAQELQDTTDKAVGTERRKQLIFLRVAPPEDDLTLGRMDEQTWDTLLQKCKTEYDKENKRFSDEKEQERLDGLKDGELWADFKSKIDAIQIPSVKNSRYKSIANIAKAKLAEIKALKP